MIQSVLQRVYLQDVVGYAEPRLRVGGLVGGGGGGLGSHTPHNVMITEASIDKCRTQLCVTIMWSPNYAQS